MDAPPSDKFPQRNGLGEEKALRKAATESGQNIQDFSRFTPFGDDAQATADQGR